MSSDKIRVDSSVSDTFASNSSNPEESYNHLLGRMLVVNEESLLISKFLGAGNMAGVLRAVYQDGIKSGETVAIKVLSPELSRPNSPFVERFKREAEAMRSLPVHPNIVGFYFSGCDNRINLHFIGLEYVEGTSLDKIVKPIPVDKAYLVAKQIARALVVSYNNNMVHRDVKPGNILVTSNWNAKLSDFGLVRGMGNVRQTVVGTALGTPLYMAPEQLRGRDNFSSDVYGLGATFYEMLAGRPPYLGEDIDEIFSQIENPKIEPPPLRGINGKISMELENLVMRTLAKDFKQRFSNSEEFLEELNKLSYVTEPENREAVEARRQDELENIIGKWRTVDISACRFDEQLRFINDWKRLLRGTVQRPDTVLKRIGWLEDMMKVWTVLEEEYPGISQKHSSPKFMLAWEENRRKHWGIKKPVPPKSFVERHSRKIIYGTIAGLVLALAGTISGFVGYDHHQKAEARREKECLILRYDDIYGGLERSISVFDFENLASGLNELRGIAGQDSLLKGRVDELEAKAKRVREEKEFSDVYSGLKGKVDAAFELVERSSNVSVRLQDKTLILVEALALIKDFEKDKARLKREHADELNERTVSLKDMIGDKLPALEQYASALEKFGEAEKQQSYWREQLGKGIFFSRIDVVKLKGDLSNYFVLLNLDNNKRHFRNDPSYESLISNIQVYERNLTTVERDLSVSRYNAAKKELAIIIESTGWLSKNYFLDDADKRVGSIDALISSIDNHLKNVNDIYLFYDSIDVFAKGFENSKSIYQSARKKFDEVAVLRKKAGENDESALIALGRLFFDGGLLADSKKYFERVKNEDLRKSAGVYLEIIALEDEIARPESKSYKKTPSGYDVYSLAGFRKAIDDYDGANEVVVRERLKELNKSGFAINIDTFGELHEAFYIALRDKGDVDSARMAVFDFLNSEYQKIDDELQKQEAVVRPELLEKRVNLYDSLKSE